MAKGQKHGNREAKKPKAFIKKPEAGAPAAPYQISIQAPKGKAGKK